MAEPYRKLIAVALALEPIDRESARGKSIRHGRRSGWPPLCALAREPV